MMNIDLAATTIKFLLVHMFRYEVLLVLFLTGIAALQLATVLSKHNRRDREVNFSKHLSIMCLVLILFLFLARQMLL